MTRYEYSPDHLRFDGMVQGVEADGLIVVSGQVALGRDGEVVGEGDAAAQADQCFTNLRAVLEGFGVGLDSVLRLTCFLADRAHYPAYAEAKRRHLAGQTPAGTAVIAGLLDERFLMEVEAVATRGAPDE